MFFGLLIWVWKKHKDVSKQAYRLLKVKLHHSSKKNIQGQTIMISGIYLVYLQMVLITAQGPVSQYRMHVRTMFMVNLIFWPSQANTKCTWRLKNILAIEMSQNNALTHGKLQRCQTQWGGDLEITTDIRQTYDL